MQRMERGPGERDDPITTILPAEVDDGGVDIAEGIDAPGKLVVKKIQAVEGITWTLTCPAVRL
jgi:hypothetical protein